MINGNDLIQLGFKPNKTFKKAIIMLMKIILAKQN